MILEVQSLTVAYGRLPVLRAVSVSVRRAEIVCLLGPNGAGKSTLIKAISGQVRVASGEIRYGGIRLNGQSPRQVGRAGIVQCPEGRCVFSSLTVQENLIVATSASKPNRREWGRRLDYVCEIFPRLKERLHQKGGTLSGGEQQMLAIARALMANPQILLLDEPSLGLAPILVDQVFQAMAQVAARGVGILLADQNAHAALRLASHGYILKNGMVVCAGERDKIRSYLDSSGGYLG